MCALRPFLPLLCALGCTSLPAQTPEAELARAQRHQSPEWQLIVPHLPDLATARPEQLMLEGDVLRARRFEEDALDFYDAALRQGGDEATLRNRIGMTELVLRRPELARVCFRRVLQLKPVDPQSWNNLGAAEYFAGNYRAALTDYLRALKFDRTSALFHSNLGTAYFELKDYDSASRQFGQALRLDPHVFEHSDTGGISARMLTVGERGRFCFELARVAAGEHRDEAVLEWLGKALDVQFDVAAEMVDHAVFAPYLHDPRVRLLINNAHALHTGRLASNTGLPALTE